MDMIEYESSSCVNLPNLVQTENHFTSLSLRQTSPCVIQSTMCKKKPQKLRYSRKNATRKVEQKRKSKRKKKRRVVNRLLLSCPHSCSCAYIDDKNSFLCMWNSLAFDLRACIWFYARHYNFFGLTYFVFSVDFSFRTDTDWSSSCTEIAGLWTYVHSFPLAAFDGCGCHFFWFCLTFFGFTCLAACTLLCTVLTFVFYMATAITLLRAPAEQKKSRRGNKDQEHKE